MTHQFVHKLPFLLMVLVILGVVSPGLSYAYDGHLVTATGMSVYQQGREAVAREKALDQAKRAVLEQALGSMVTSISAVENQRLVMDRIVSRTAGYIQHYEIVDEQAQPSGTYSVTIEAVVAMKAMTQDADLFQQMIDWQKNPRISIFIEPNLDKRYGYAARQAANLLTAQLHRAGFKVYAPSAKDHMQLGFLIGLDVALEVQQSDYRGMILTLNEIAMHARAYRAGDQEVIATAEAVKSIPGENRFKALEKGVIQCVAHIWSTLRRELIGLWEEELNSARDISLTLKNVPDYPKAVALAGMLRADVQGVTQARLINFSQNQAEIGLKYRGWPEQFLAEINMSYFKQRHFSAKLLRLSGNTLIVELGVAKEK